jgi:hypothetical protein
MTIGTAVLGDAAIISVAPNSGTEAAPVAGTYIPVSDLNSVSKNSTRNVTTSPVFGRLTAYQIPGSRDQSYSLGGFLSAGDSGQALIVSNEQANTTFFVKVLPDGTNGWSQAVKCGSRTFNATPEGLQGVTFALSGVADPVVVGTGPLI